MRRIPLEEVKPDADIPQSFIGCESDNFGRYILLREDAGWIFRLEKNRQFGHSGHSPTKKAACYKAIVSGGTYVFTFDTWQDLHKWLLNKPA